MLFVVRQDPALLYNTKSSSVLGCPYSDKIIHLRQGEKMSI